MLVKLIISVVVLFQLVVAEDNSTVLEDEVTKEDMIMREVERDLNRISLLIKELSYDSTTEKPPLPGQKPREPAASLFNLVRSLLHLLESMTGQSRIEGDEVQQIVKEINRLFYTATRMIHGEPGLPSFKHRKGRTFDGFYRYEHELDPHYNRIKDIVQNMFTKKRINSKSPSSVSSPSSPCDCNQIKAVNEPVVTSPPLTASIQVSPSPSTVPASVQKALVPGRKGRFLGLDAAIEASTSQPQRSGPWKSGDGFLKDNSEASVTVDPLGTPPPPPEPVVEPEEIIPSIQPVSNSTEVPSGQSPPPTPVVVPVANLTVPGVSIPNWVPPLDPLRNLATGLNEFTNALTSFNKRVASITSVTSKLIQTSARVISGQLRTNDPTWVYGEPLRRATEGYAEILRSLAGQLSDLGRQFSHLRETLVPSFRVGVGK